MSFTLVEGGLGGQQQQALAYSLEAVYPMDIGG